MAYSELTRIAFAFLVFSMERLATMSSTFSDNSLNDIFRYAIMTSRIVHSLCKGSLVSELFHAQLRMTFIKKSGLRYHPIRFQKSFFKLIRLLSRIYLLVFSLFSYSPASLFLHSYIPKVRLLRFEVLLI